MKKVLVAFVFIVLSISISFIVIKCIDKPKDIKIKDNITINIGDEIPDIKKYVNEKDYEKLKDCKISWKDIDIENKKIYYTGKYLGIIKYKDKKYNVHLTVIDKVAPTIEGVKDYEIYVNEKIDFYKDIKINDNSKDEIKKEIVGEYDFSKKGTYNLKYVITDKSNNKIEKEFKLVVKEKPVIKVETETNNKEVPSTTTKGYKIEYNNGAYYINGILVANKSYSLSSNYNPGGLTSVFMTNYNKMNEDAKNEGINLKIISGFRSYSTQKTLYNNYVNRDGKAAADRYSARAGHSEHQSGLAADINSLEQSWENTKEGKWLNDNCYKYGFIIRYPKGKESITGYMFEPWHIRYVGVDVATAIYNNGNWSTLEEYLGIDSKY